jgi:hypothetical protein
MATHMMEKDMCKDTPYQTLTEQNSLRVSQFISHLMAGLFSETIELGDRSGSNQAFGAGFLGYLNYDWPILNAKSS